jgi:predicted DNA-binding transcriptional regulator AlpA
MTILTSRETAAIIGVSEQTLRAWRLKGFGPVYRRVGSRTIRYLRRDVDEYMQRRGYRSTSEYGQSTGKPTDDA